MTKDAFFPEYLTSRRCWVLWRLETVKDRKTKVPYSARNPQYHASSTNPDTWETFEDAVKVYRNNHEQFNGIGCVMSEKLGAVCIDLDHSLDPETGEMNQKASEIFRLFSDTYCEVSQSGTGLHIFALGTIPRGLKNSKMGVEMYFKGRFIAMTGNAMNHCDVINKQNELSSVYEKYKTASADQVANCHPLPLDLDDSQIIQKAAKADAQFMQLYSEQDGWKRMYQSQSEADLRLCGMLAFWCNRDQAAIDRIFRSSVLFRGKWDEMRGEQSYGSMTIQKACASCRECYAEWKERKDNEAADKRKRWADAIINHWDDQI